MVQAYKKAIVDLESITEESSEKLWQFVYMQAFQSHKGARNDQLPTYVIGADVITYYYLNKA